MTSLLGVCASILDATLIASAQSQGYGMLIFPLPVATITAFLDRLAALHADHGVAASNPLCPSQPGNRMYRLVQHRCLPA